MPRSVVRMAALLCWCACFSAAFIASAQPESQPAEAGAAEPVPAPGAESEADELEQKKASAKEHFLRGLELTQNENWDGALAEFLASLEIYRTSVALKNAALSYRQLGRDAEALASYEDLLREFGDSLKPQDKKLLEDSIAALKARVGQIIVISDPPQSRVVIDGTQRGTTPLLPVRVNAGTHSVVVSKAGYAPFETQVVVAGGQQKTVKADLSALTKSGTLIVKDADGRKLDVYVDGAHVGATPWTGQVAAGTHTVFLRGEDNMGTPPSTASVFENQTSTLSLRATKLDAQIRIEPTPSNARVDIDGVQVGNGVWEGRLKSGTHKVEITADGFLAYREDVNIESGRSEVRKVSLERDLENPRWNQGFRPHLYIEAVVGPAWAPSFGGQADKECSRDDCDRSAPFGFLAGGRVGYALTSGLGLEVFGGYLYMKQSMTRSVKAEGEGNERYDSTNYQDEGSFAGLTGAVSASYRFLDKTPLTVRASVGVSRVRTNFKNSGTFSGCLVRMGSVPPPGVPDNCAATGSFDASIPERRDVFWVPFIAPEVRYGYKFSDRFSIDAGLAFYIFFPPERPRAATDNNLDDDDVRVTVVPETGKKFELPKETGYGTFFALIPTLGGRFDF